MTKRPLTKRHAAGVLALHRSSLGSLTDEQLHERIGPYASNVIKSLVSRELIELVPSLALGAESSEIWALTARGAQLARELEPSPRRCCPTCGQPLPVAAE
jgi:hypothetical protein